MPNKDLPYSFVQVKAGDFIRLANGEEVQVAHGGLAVVFDDCVLGPFQSRHIAEIEASHKVRTMLNSGGGR